MKHTTLTVIWYLYRMATLMDRVTGGMQTPTPVAATNAGPQISTRGRQRLSPNSAEVEQVKQGKHQKA